MSPLHCACVSGRLSVVRQLLQYGADLTAKTSHGNTCLHVACINGQSCIVSELLTRSNSLLLQRNNNQQVWQHTSVSHDDMLQFYIGFIRPVLEYAVAAWHTAWSYHRTLRSIGNNPEAFIAYNIWRVEF